MALPYSFSNNTSPTGVQLDADLAALGNMGIWNCSSSGTNAIALTTTANQPAVAAYTDRQRFQFVAAANSTGSVTVAVNSLAALPLYLITGTQAASGDVTIGTPYEIIYLSALNSGGGGFQIFSAVPSSAAVAVANGYSKGLTITNNSGTPTTKIDIAAGYTCLVTTGGTPKFLSSFSATIDLTTTGANGMDTGSRPTSGWVYLYEINNGSVSAGLATATSPTAGLPNPFPGGYSYFNFVGAMYCDGSQNLLRTYQRGRAAQYQITASTNTALIPIIGNGAAGSFSNNSPTLASVTVAGNGQVVPLTAGAIKVVVYNNWKNGTGASVLVAPNTGWGGTNNGPVGSVGQVFPLYLNSASSSTGIVGEIVLESTAIAWCSSASGGAIGCQGWTDYWAGA